MTSHPTPLIPPPVTDRRAPDRRTLDERQMERQEAIRTGVAAAIAICGGLALMFAFFAAVGSVNVGNAIVATLVALALAAIWAGGIIYARRHSDGRINRHDRERRGF